MERELRRCPPLPIAHDLGSVVLPRPHVGGGFLFELGAGIPSVTLSDGQAYDHLRAYCSIRMP